MMTDAQRGRLELQSRLGKTVRFKRKGDSGSRVMGTVEDEVYVMVNDYKHMIQRIRFADGMAWGDCTHAYRSGYYTYDAGMKHIKWGQYTQFVTEKEFKSLLSQARNKGWDIF